MLSLGWVQTVFVMITSLDCIGIEFHSLELNPNSDFVNKLSWKLLPGGILLLISANKPN